MATPPPAIVQIAQHVQRRESGVVSYDLTRTFDAHVGPLRRHEELQLAIVSQDGTTVKVRVIRYQIGGRDQDANARAQIEEKYEHPNPQDVFHRPFDLRYLNEYTYDNANAQTVHFMSRIQDSSHADGSFTLDKDGNVVEVEYSPKVLPQYASAGTVTDDRAQVLPNYWSVTREVHHYRGHYAIFGGHADVDIEYSQFKRFADLQSATAALGSGP